jgi:hypothetical protein
VKKKYLRYVKGLREMLKKKAFIGKAGLLIAVFILASRPAFPQDSGTRILDLLDDVLNAAVEAGKDTPPAPRQPAAKRPSFYILNNTGFTVKSIYVCRTDTADWGPDIFTGPYLYNGRSVLVTPDERFDGAENYNIRLVDVDGDFYSKYNVKISDRDTLRISIDDFEFEK